MLKYQVPRPLAICANTTVTRTYRFRSTYDLPVIITAQALVGIAGAVGTVANTTVVAVAESFRIHRVTVWSPPRQGNPAAGLGQFSSSIATIEWHSLDNIPSQRLTDEAISPSEPAYVSSKPPRGSAAYQWQDGPTGGNIMTLTCVVGGIIDVHISHTLFASGTSGGAYTANPVVVGAYYYMPLDGVGTVRYLPEAYLPTTY